MRLIIVLHDLDIVSISCNLATCKLPTITTKQCDILASSDGSQWWSWWWCWSY